MGMGPGSRAALGHVDVQTGKLKSWKAGANRALQEPCFIQKSPTAAEGEGYIVQIQPHTDDGLSDLLLFDAQHVDEGPMATIHIPLSMRFGLHGNWVPEATLAKAKSARAP
jgi:carotenoid cleavage dioxygenase-like enzyme